MLDYRDVPTTTSHAVKRLVDLTIPKTHMAAIRPQPPGRPVSVIHLLARLPRAAVPIIRPLIREDHDPLPETSTMMRSWRG